MLKTFCLFEPGKKNKVMDLPYLSVFLKNITNFSGDYKSNLAGAPRHGCLGIFPERIFGAKLVEAGPGLYKFFTAFIEPAGMGTISGPHNPDSFHSGPIINIFGSHFFTGSN